MDGPAGTGPDVLTMPGDQIGTAVTEGLLKELHVEKDVQSLYTDASIQSQMVDQKLYGSPKAVETTVLFTTKISSQRRNCRKRWKSGTTILKDS